MRRRYNSNIMQKSSFLEATFTYLGVELWAQRSLEGQYPVPNKVGSFSGTVQPPSRNRAWIPVSTAAPIVEVSPRVHFRPLRVHEGPRNGQLCLATHCMRLSL